MGYSEKGTVEDFIIEELKKLGWKYLTQKEVETKRKGRLEEPLVLEDLRESVRKLNPDIQFSDADLDFIAVSLRTIPSNLEGIRKFLDIFRNGMVVPIQK
jgi:type I site-specific restriction-modification system R (restriction) subunit